MRWIDGVIIFTYIASLVCIGLVFSRRQKTTERYFIAKREIPGWALGMSLFATIITSVTFIAYPGSAYEGDWSLLFPGLMIICVLGLIGFFVVPFFRAVVAMSAYEYFGKRFGSGIRLYSSLTFAIGHFSKMAFVLYLLSLTVSGMTGWRIDFIILATGVITILYTLIGGMETVIWTDVVQGFLLLGCLLFTIGYLFFLSPGGPGEMLRLAAAHHKFSLGSTSLSFNKPTLIVLAIYGFFFYLQKYTADQTVVQRYLVARTDRSALKGIALGASLCIPVWTLFMLIGTLLWCFYQITGTSLPAYITKTDQIFPHFLIAHVPPGLSGLFVAALFGAAMSMLASDLNCLALIGVRDFYLFLRPQTADKKQLKIAKIMVATSGLMAVFVALQLAHTRGTALSLYYTISSIVAGGLAGLFMLAVLSSRSSRRGAQIGILASLLFTTYATITSGPNPLFDLGSFNFPWHSYMIGAIGNITLLVVGIIFSVFFPDQDREESKPTIWTWRKTPVQKSFSGVTT